MKRFLLSICFSASAFGASALPPKKPLLGIKKLACIAVQWTDNKVVNETNCGNMSKAVKDFYERNSCGKLTLKTSGGTVQMGIADGPNQVNAGEQAALKKFPGQDYYIIPNTASSGPDHAGGHIAHLNQILSTVAEHETGHLLSLGHATRLDITGCCDKGSIMNPESKPSNFLTAPQYYFLGWMTADEYVLYAKAGSFQLKHPLDSNAGTSSVIVSPTSMGHPADARFAFISYAPMCDSGNPCVAIHLANNGGSQLVKGIAVGSSYYDAAHTGLDIAVAAGATPANVQITVSIH